MAYVTNLQLRGLSFNQLVKMVDTGQVSEKRLRSYYSEARKLAIGREKRRQASEFGEVLDKEVFRKQKSLITTSDLLHEIADVNKFLNRKSSTITGLKEQRQQTIDTLSEHGIDIDESQYNDWVRFMKWFKNSKYSVMFDSDSEEVAEAFQQGSNSSDWGQLFEEFNRQREAAHTRREKR